MPTLTLIVITTLIATLNASGALYASQGHIKRTGTGWGRGPGAARPADAAALPPQGLYEGCAPGSAPDACAERLAAIRAAGFRYVLNYSAWYGSPAAVLGYADAAAALGLRLIWPLNNPAWRGLADLDATYPALAGGAAGEGAPPHRSRRGPRRRSLQHFPHPGVENAARGSGRPRHDGPDPAASPIRLVADHPATWGFYIGDELSLAEVPRVRALSATVRRVAPDKPQLYIARPGIERLRRFARFADLAGADAYPVGSGDPPVGRVARSARIAATGAGARTAMVLQAFSWSQYADWAGAPLYPSERSLRAMRDAAIRSARPAMILWYSYQDILRSDDPQRHWRDLVRAAFSPSP